MIHRITTGQYEKNLNKLLGAVQLLKRTVEENHELLMRLLTPSERKEELRLYRAVMTTAEGLINAYRTAKEKANSYERGDTVTLEVTAVARGDKSKKHTSHSGRSAGAGRKPADRLHGKRAKAQRRGGGRPAPRKA